MDNESELQKTAADWLREEAQTGIEQIGRGEFIEEHEMAERVGRMLKAIEMKGRES